MAVTKKKAVVAAPLFQEGVAQNASFKDELAEMKKVRDRLLEKANKEIADKLESIDTTIDEIKELATLAGIEHLDVNSLYYKVDSFRDDFRNWDSSSC